MALDKLVDSVQLDSDLASVANAIRTKGGTSASLAFPQGFVDAVGAIQTGGGGVVLVTGTLTLAARTPFNGFSLDVGIDCDFFALYATESPLQANGRTYCGMFHDFTATTALNTINCTSNSGGSVYLGSLTAGNNISKTGTVLNFTTTDYSNFQAGVTYLWYAWGG